ncbi:MAG: PSD1 and planctomycete cytochrome C domain-containing protein [Verrucomicrobiota bacterium]
MKTSNTAWPALAILGVWGAAVIGTAAPAQLTPQQLDFFEKKIRPVLADKCYKCHSAEADKVKAALFVDSRDGLLKGGDNGPSVVPGDPDKSLLIKAIRYQSEDLKMPPKGEKLPDAVIADFEKWVKDGMPDPRDGSVDKYKQAAKEAERSHWSFKPVVKPAEPQVKLKGWISTPVDNFILAQLEEKAMRPSLQADRRTLIRRAYFDMIGLPPRPEEVKAFLEDKSPNAFEKVVDQLLASPHYGERWGRYWLDIARYADTKGDVNTQQEDPRFPFAWTYRDYVVKSFNDDKPYDRFLVEQIAADKMPESKQDPTILAALGFLSLGKRFAGNNNDIIDDRIDVVTKGTMALTVTCARCHDHKFDPIPTKDYYSMHGVFASSIEPRIEPLLGQPKETPEFKDFTAKLEQLEQSVRDYRTSNENRILHGLRTNITMYLYAAVQAPRITDGGQRNLFIRTNRLDGGILGAWQRTLDTIRRNQKPNAPSPIWYPLLEFAKLKDDEFDTKGKVLAANIAASKVLNPRIARAFAGEAPGDLKDVAIRYGRELLKADQEWKDHLVAYENRKRVASKPPPPPTSLPDKYTEDLRLVLYSPNSPAHPPSDQITRLFEQNVRQREVTLRGNIVALKLTHPGAPPSAQALMDSPSPRDSRIFIRGNASSLGDVAPRQFLGIIAGDDRQPFKDGSGRLEMARAIASRDNPLTARVMVNRIWMNHFGEGIVSTTSDFGTRCSPPTHPELLDYLSAYFMDNGWSMKKLHKLILLSSTYQQSSDDNPRYSQLDPGNKLMWRMNLRRLDFEALRDSLLAIGGKLDLKVGGQPVNITDANVYRRTIYGMVDRGRLPEVFNHFDFANPDLTTSKRYMTTVPQQSLFLMNNPMVVEQARNLVQRPDFLAVTDDDKRVQLLYELVYQRAPRPEEVKLAQYFLEQLPAVTDVAPEQTWKYGYGEVDEQTKRVKQFDAMPNFANGVWQSAPRLPHKTLGYVQLNAKGGHAGPNLKAAAIRRWTAPRDGFISIDGTLGHANTNKCDGVRARIVSSQAGELAQWIAFNKQLPTRVPRFEVRKGDTIDFVIDCRATDAYDGFTWAPIITMIGEKGEVMAGLNKEWAAEKNFSGTNRPTLKSLSAWEKYAHVLLLSNEVSFVN